MKPDAGVRGREVLVVLPRAALRIRTFTNDTYQTTVMYRDTINETTIKVVENRV